MPHRPADLPFCPQLRPPTWVHPQQVEQARPHNMSVKSPEIHGLCSFLLPSPRLLSPLLHHFTLPGTSLSLSWLQKHTCLHERHPDLNSPTTEASLPGNKQLTTQSRDFRVTNFFLCPRPHILPITEFSSHPSCDHLRSDLHHVFLDSCPLTGPLDSSLSLH